MPTTSKNPGKNSPEKKTNQENAPRERTRVTLYQLEGIEGKKGKGQRGQGKKKT